MSRAEIEASSTSIVELSGLDEVHPPADEVLLLRHGRAAALCHRGGLDPEILLIDEALNTGDAQFADRSKARMDELREQAGTSSWSATAWTPSRTCAPGSSGWTRAT